MIRYAPVLVMTTAIVASVALATGVANALHLGPLSRHMLEHIALLSLAAPIGAWALRNRLPLVSGRALSAAAILQISLIWIWHFPPVFAAAQESPSAHAAMNLSLYLAGLLFWCAIFGLADRNRWQAIVALLLTGKLFCLFAAVLVFSPRDLFGLGVSHAQHATHAAFTGLRDQQLAGLIMISVCPLTYVAAGVSIAIRWLAALETRYPEGLQVKLRTISTTLPLLFLLCGCNTIQSPLSPASLEASTTLHLTWILSVGAGAIFAFVMVLTALAMFGAENGRAKLRGSVAVILGGVAFPVVVLSSLLAYGLWLASAAAGPSEDAQTISVKGERWWWRVTYEDDGRGQAATPSRLASANEIRVEVGRPVHLKLTSADVIHSFWVPALAGKVDLIPGRTNELRFTPTRAGTFRGQCAEYCGGAHAMMALRVIAMEPADFAEWFESHRQSAVGQAGDTAIARGRELFMSSCVACHSVRGTEAAGRLGPDLTHVATRSAIGGELLPTTKDNIKRWLAENDRLKPNNLMPVYRHLPVDDLDALASYVASLR